MIFEYVTTKLLNSLYVYVVYCSLYVYVVYMIEIYLADMVYKLTCTSFSQGYVGHLK